MSMGKETKYKVIYRPLASLTLLDDNPRVIKDNQFAKLCKSIKDNPELFEAQPIILSDRTGELVIIAGNQRYKAAKEVGLAEAPTVLLSGLTEAKEREIIIRTNVLNGEWDWDLLRDEWNSDELEDWGVDMPDFMDDTDVQPTVQGKPIEDDDFDEEKDDVPQRCTRGDIWQLGDHRLMCGDSTNAQDVAALLGGEQMDMVFTDPPYGIAYGGGRGDKFGQIKNDELQDSQLGGLIAQIFNPQFKMEDIDKYICVSPIMTKPFLDEVARHNTKENAIIVWNKGNAGLGWMAYRRQCEFIIFIKGKPFHKGDKQDIDLWNIGKDDASEYVHPNQKPIEVSGRAIRNSTEKGANVLDIFGGSGSTLIACEKLHRRCFTMELDEYYCDVILARFEKLTGKKATKINNDK